MKIKNKFNLILMAVLFGIVAITLFCFLLFSEQNKNKIINGLSDKSFGWKFPTSQFPPTVANQDLLGYSSLRNSGGIPQGLPVRLEIPVIGVDSAVEDALITPDGKMDVPEGSKNVAWFALGPHPGDVGSAVIGGHFGIQNDVPFVFYNLDKLRIGDKIYVVNDKGDTLTFQVRLIELFDRNADATTVFTSSDGLAHLNLITCEGIWNQTNGNYPERRVVFADAIPGEGKVVVKALPVISAFYQTLRFGAEGADVVALQNFLQRKGFLKILPGAVDGFFGVVTRVAVLKYQASVGLSPDGIFGPLTRAKLILEQSAVAVKSNFPSTGLIVPESNPTSKIQIIVSSFKSLYGNLTDGIITSLLFISIILVILKIIL